MATTSRRHQTLPCGIMPGSVMATAPARCCPRVPLCPGRDRPAEIHGASCWQREAGRSWRSGAGRRGPGGLGAADCGQVPRVPMIREHRAPGSSWRDRGRLTRRKRTGMSAILLLQGDALHLPLEDKSIHTIITSPPYFGLRQYNGLEPTSATGRVLLPEESAKPRGDSRANPGADGRVCACVGDSNAWKHARRSGTPNGRNNAGEGVRTRRGERCHLRPLRCVEGRAGKRAHASDVHMAYGAGTQGVLSRSSETTARFFLISAIVRVAAIGSAMAQSRASNNRRIAA